MMATAVFFICEEWVRYSSGGVSCSLRYYLFDGFLFAIFIQQIKASFWIIETGDNLEERRLYTVLICHLTITCTDARL